jgi:NAD+ kinase
MSTRVQPKTGTVALYVDLRRDHARSTAQRVAGAIRGAGFAVALCDGQDASLTLATPGASVEGAFLLVTIGGDGTLLLAAQLAAPLGIPLFGINTGRLGFLTEIDGDGCDPEPLLAILRNGFVLEERTALEATVHGRAHVALNDIVVRRVSSSHMMPFGIFVDRSEAARVPADGIAVATPTGSTAYFMSAGGPILAPDVAAFGIVALLPHTLFSRPLVVADTARVALGIEGEGDRATLEADGRVVDELRAGDRVEIVRYHRPVVFARDAPLDFYVLLEKKLRWNAPVKDERAN